MAHITIDIVVRCSQKEGVFMRKVLVAVFTACLLALFLSTQMAFAQDVTVCPPGGGEGGCDSYARTELH
jgi:hypothetical protein